MEGVLQACTWKVFLARTVLEVVTQLSSERILHSWVELEERSRGRYSNLGDCSGLLDFEGCAEQPVWCLLREQPSVSVLQCARG